MNIIKTEIPEVVLIEPKVFGDERGYFFESFSQRIFEEKVRKIDFVQDNESKSSYGVVRGLHYQLPPFAQSKLVRAVKGRILDIALDIRKGSPTFGRYTAQILSDENKKQMFIPRGFAHGFAALSDEVIFSYKCDNYYAPDYEAAVVFNDLQLGIDWQIPDKDMIISDKDRKHPLFKDAVLFDYKEDLYE